MSAEQRTRRDVPANIEPFVEALGVDLAIRFLLEYGGAQCFIPKDPTGSNAAVVLFLGVAKAKALVQVVGAGIVKVPVGRKWIARELYRRDESANAIARKVRTDVSTVRRWRLRNTDQLDLVDWLEARIKH